MMAQLQPIGQYFGQSGDVIILSSTEHHCKASFRMEILSSEGGLPRLILACESNPYHRLHLFAKEASFKAVSSPNRNCILYLRSLPQSVVESEAGQEVFALTTSAGKDGSLSYLLMLPDGSFSAAELPLACLGDVHGLGRLVISAVVKASATVPPQGMPRPAATAGDERECAFRLKQWQLRNFAIHGFLRLSSIVPLEKVKHCSRHLLHHVGQVGTLLPGAIQGGNYGKLPGSFSQAGFVRDLFCEEVKMVVKALLGSEMAGQLHPQIALRFPQLPSEGITQRWDWHTDGYRQGFSHSFSLLVGIPLSRVDGDYQGNLCVWPGSHFLLHKCRIGIHGDIDVPKLQDQLSHNSLYDDFRSKEPPAAATEVESKEVWFEAEQEVLLKRPPLPSLGNPEQLRTEPGDIVILHPDLAHMGGPNYSNRVREMIFFRVRCATPLSTASSSLPLQSWAEVEAAHGEDLWVDLLGLKRVLAGELKSITQLYTADGI